MKTTRILCLMSAVLLMLTSCRSKKNLVSQLNGPSPEQARYESVVNNQFGYEALQSKSKYSMGGNSLGGKMCLEPGRRVALQVNAPMLGFEIARVEATQESVLIVDKYDKIYSVARLSELYQLDEISGHEMEALECILLGRIYLPGHGVATAKDYKMLAWTTPTLADGSKGNSVGVYTGKNYSLRYDIDATGRLASTMLTVGNRSVQLDYAAYSEVEKGKWIPTQETITATGSDGQSVKAGLTLTNPSLGESTWREFEPSSSYKQVPIDELVKTIKSMMK